MSPDRSVLYDSADSFFTLSGSVVMKLTPAAAIQVCREAGRRGIMVLRVEGGIWHSPGFEARIDCIWDGADPPTNQAKVHDNNVRAARFIQAESSVHSAFILTTTSITG